ncbi:TolC family protein [Robertkochia flava]|uniref:TolC family protein n=1 Tax=Robertkochia flava TaxID=3447986 RepID=UPI001CCB517B|nr:TolC family protein [Robertkochia marina]
MKKCLIIGLFISLFQVQAQQKQYSFTMEEAINFALDSSYTALNSRRDVARALKQKWETTAAGLPQIDGTVDYQNQLKQPVSPIPAEFFGGEPGEFIPVVFGVRQQMNATATLRQLIFDGSYLVGLEAASTFLDYNENANEKTRLEVRKAVINAYGSVLVTRERVDILEKDRATLEENLREATVTFENGLAEEETVEQLQITFLQIQTELSNSIRMQGIAEEMLNITLGIPVEAEVVLEDDLGVLAMRNMTAAILQEDFNPESNVDFKIAKNLTEQRELELKLEKSRALPSLNAFVNYGTTAFDQDFIFLNRETPWYQSSVLGVSLNIPIFSSLMRSARTQQAKIALEQSKTSFTQATQQIELEYNRARSNFRYAVEKFDTSRQNLDLAERIEGKNQVKLREGIGSSFELRQAQTQLYRAQEEYIMSMLDVINARAELETIINTPDLRIDN